MLYDFDRFEDAIRTRAEQFCSPVASNSNNYIAGYLMSMMKEFYDTIPGAEKRINDTITYLEDTIRRETLQKYSEAEMIATLDNSL